MDNVELIDQKDLNAAFTNYYKDIFGKKSERRIKANWSDLYPPKTRIDLNDLDSPFSEDEIWKATYDMPSDKAPGPDGFPILFYKTFLKCFKIRFDFYVLRILPRDLTIR